MNAAHSIGTFLIKEYKYPDLCIASHYYKKESTFSGTLSVSQAEALEELLPNSAPMVVANESEPLAL